MCEDLKREFKTGRRSSVKAEGRSQVQRRCVIDEGGDIYWPPDIATTKQESNCPAALPPTVITELRESCRPLVADLSEWADVEVDFAERLIHHLIRAEL